MTPERTCSGRSAEVHFALVTACCSSLLVGCITKDVPCEPVADGTIPIGTATHSGGYTRNDWGGRCGSSPNVDGAEDRTFTLELTEPSRLELRGERGKYEIWIQREGTCGAEALACDHQTPFVLFESSEHIATIDVTLEPGRYWIGLSQTDSEHPEFSFRTVVTPR